MLSFILYFIGALAVAPIIFGIIYRRLSGICSSPNSLKGKTVIITGATAGIGKEAAKDLADRGAKTILGCRNRAKAEKVKEWIISKTGNKNVIIRLLDVSDLDSVRTFAKETLEKEERLDVLINNAGVGMPTRQESKQGFELTHATNHLGHFLLTNLLLGLLRKSGPSRVINVSSAAYKWDNLDLDDLHFKNRTYSWLKAYCQSKLCNILFTKELAHYMTGKGVTVNALHPGVAATEISKKVGNFSGFLVSLLMIVAGKTSEQGAQTTIYLAVSDEVSKTSGEYFVDCKNEDVSKRAHDPGLAKRLWEISEEEVGLKKEEMHYLN